MEREHLGTDALLTALLAAMDTAEIGCTVVTDRDGKLQRAYSNEPFARMAGMTVEELNNTPPFEIVAPEERERISKIRPTIDPYPSRLVTKMKRRNGTLLPIEVSLGRVPLEHGQAVVAFLHDLTPRVEMETALRESEERFRTIAESCPDAITMVSDLRYVYANPTARRLLGVTSDEDLARIDPMASVPVHLRDQVVERNKRVMAGQTATLASIEEGVNRMKSVISDLLFLTRTSDAPQAHVDLRQIILSTLSLVKAGAPTARIETELAETSRLYAHPSRLGQVILNVMLNALEAVSHCDDGLVRVTLREKDAWLEVCVIDNGVGVPDDCRTRVFDPFFTTKPAGTGLGLSISHAIVTAHGGQIAIETTGNPAMTTLKILLPKA